MNNTAITYNNKLWTALPAARHVIFASICCTTGYPPLLNDAIVKYNEI